MARATDRVRAAVGRRKSGRRTAGRFGERSIAHPESLETRMAPSETLSSLLAAHVAEANSRSAHSDIDHAPALERRWGAELSAGVAWQVNFSRAAQRLWARSAGPRLDVLPGWSLPDSDEHSAGDHAESWQERGDRATTDFGQSLITGPLAESLLNVWSAPYDESAVAGRAIPAAEAVTATSQTRAPAGGGSTSSNQLSASPAPPPDTSDSSSIPSNTTGGIATSTKSTNLVERGNGESSGRKDVPGDSSPSRSDNSPVTNQPGVDWVDVALNYYTEQTGESSTSNSPAVVNAAIAALTQKMLTSPRGGEELERELFARYGRERRQGVGQGQQQPGSATTLLAAAGTGTGTGGCSGSSSTSGANNNPPVGVADAPYFSAIDSLNTRPLRNSGLHASVLANDYDCDASKLTASIYAKPTNGTATMQSDGTFVYTPKPGHSGADVLWYRAYDGKYLSSPTPVTIYTIGADIDADSNNFYSLERNTIEDNAEMIAPGKVFIDGRAQDNGSMRSPIAVSLMGADQLSTADLPKWTARIVPPANSSTTVDYFQYDSGTPKPLLTIPASDMLNRLQFNNPQLFYTQQSPGWVGTTNYKLQLVTPQNTLFHTDSVMFTGIKMPGMKAFRQQTTAGATSHYDDPHYDMFRRREILDSELPLGIPIRRNGDDDVASSEDDYVELLAENIANLPGVEFRLKRSSDLALQVYDFAVPGADQIGLFSPSATEPNRSPELSMPITANLPNSEAELWAEWQWNPQNDPVMDANSANLTLEVFAANTGQKLASTQDYLFDPVDAAVFVFLGEFQNPSDPPMKEGQGTVSLAIDLYSKGYDVFMLEEPDTSDGLTGSLETATTEFRNAVNKRGVTEAAFIGYSHGGGFINQVISELQQETNSGAIKNQWRIPLTSYIDAINVYSHYPETRRPAGSEFHLGFYQYNTWTLHGAPSSGDIDLDLTLTGVTHTTIDDSSNVRNITISNVENRVSR